MEIIARLLNSDSFLGIVGGSLFTIIGVVFANMGNRALQKRQLDHDRQLADRERLLSLKRDVYLDATEALQAGISAIAHLAHLDISDQQLSAPYLEKSPAVAKVHAVGDDETIRTVVALSARLSAVIIELAPARGRVVDLTRQISDTEGRLNEAVRERDQREQRAYEQVLGGPLGQVDNVRELRELAYERVELLDGELRRLHEERKKVHLPLLEQCVHEIGALTPLITGALAAIRKELELPFNPSRYSAVLRSAQDSQLNAITTLIKQLQGESLS